MSDERRGLSRREALAGAAAAGVGAGAFILLRGGPEEADSAALAPNCVLAPEQTEGPYYIDDGLIRSRINETRKGVPLDLRLRVVDAASCEPIKGATVEVWHCDAVGDYSGFSTPSEKTYLRGGQRSGAAGGVRFRTIYPGWYQGRTTHIHVKVHVGGQVVHTGQLYFPDKLTSSVYASRSPYKSRGQKDTPNALDGIYGSGGKQSTLRLTKHGAGYVGRLALGVGA